MRKQGTTQESGEVASSPSKDANAVEGKGEGQPNDIALGSVIAVHQSRKTIRLGDMICLLLSMYYKATVLSSRLSY